MTSTHLTARLAEVLDAILSAYERQPAGNRRRLLHLRMGGGNQGFNGWDEEQPDVDRDDLDELRSFGLIDIEYGSSGSYMVMPTAQGRNVVTTLRRERRMKDESGPVDLEWTTVRPVLHAVVDVWTEHGASQSAHIAGRVVAEAAGREADTEFVRICQALDRAGWIHLSFDEDDDAPRVQPTMQGVIATRDWPGAQGDALAEQALARLDKLLSTERNPKRRKRLEGLRAAIMEVGVKTLAELISKSVGTAV